MKETKDRSIRVWIEIDRHPTDHALNEYRVIHLNKMMEKLNGIKETFWYSIQDETYNVNEGGGTFKQIPDNGQWFNLEYFSK